MPLRDDLLNPIPGDNPGGADLRYDPLYDKIKEARREEEDVPTGGWDRPRKLADWAAVVKLASDALATKTKDLQIAIWLTEAMFRREGFGGLATTELFVKDLLEKFWDHLYPEIEDGDLELRAAPLLLLGHDSFVTRVKLYPVTKSGLDLFKYRESRSVGYEADAGGDYDKLQTRKKELASGKMAAEDFDKEFDATPKAWYKQQAAEMTAALAGLATLEESCRQRFGVDAPGFRALREGIEEVQRITGQLLARKLELDPDPVEATPEPAETAFGEAAAVTGSAGPLTAEPTSKEDAAQRIVGAARWLRRSEPTSPVPYLMLRALRWGELRAQAPDVEPKLLAAPTPQSRTQLRSLMLDGRWPELLDAAETVMGTPAGRGWLDLQRYALRACEELGPEYASVASGIRSELRAILREVPRLIDMTLMDDMPSASPDSRTWLRQEFSGAARDEEVALPAAPGADDDSAAAAPPAPVAWDGRDRVLERALTEARGGRPQKAIELLMRELDREKSQRGRFVRQSQLAQVMVECGYETIAMPILNEMLQRIDTHKLEEWEPGTLVAQPLALLYRCLEKTGDSSSRKGELYLRICRLDPVQAIGFAPAS